MKERFDDFLRGLPQATTAWTCPWFRCVVAVSCIALLLALALDHRVSDITIVLPTAMLFFVLGTRLGGSPEVCIP